MAALPQAQDLHGVTIKLKQATRSGLRVDVPDVRRLLFLPRHHACHEHVDDLAASESRVTGKTRELHGRRKDGREFPL